MSINKNSLFITALILLFPYFTNAQNTKWQAQWITTADCKNNANTWLAYRKEIVIEKVPAHTAAKIAADSKYWLWVNGKQVVFEGGLKRGPDPLDTYYDEIDITSYLKPGRNTFSVLVWYFGKDGFSHKSSGKAGLLFDCQTPYFSLLSDKTWRCSVVKAYQTADDPLPNYRLSESNILYDARMGNWQPADCIDTAIRKSVELGRAGSAPWNNLVLRPIPLWKNSGIKSYINLKKSSSSTIDTLIGSLPYNAQVTPYLKVEAIAGQKIIICTDNYLFYNGGEANIRGEYITKSGVQEYENLGWLNGHKVYYIIPKGIKVLDLGYRETGYDTEFAGNFTSSDPFFNLFWKKAQRTLYLTMRDSYMDCPDRERAQWTGDATNESGEAFYALSTSSHALAKKWLHELIGCQKADSSLFAPVPAGSWTTELPAQSAASIGYYGLWNYYLNTGDKQTLADLYDGAKRYVDCWKLNNKGTIIFRKVGWPWGDWGDNVDMLIIYNSWYYLVVRGLQKMAIELGKTDDAVKYASIMATFKTSFNQQFWDGAAYRDPAYTQQTDDRAQALAVVSGLAGEDKYPAILKVFQTEEHASPYMEKYVFEAMFKMGYETEALKRFKKRFEKMVNNPKFTTLFEGWGIGKEGFGGGTVDHAWSGGGLTVLSQYLCGIAPVEPGYKTFHILPQPGPITHASAEIASVAGKINTSFTNTADMFTLTASVPTGTKAIIGLPGKNYRQITLNGVTLWQNGRYTSNKNATLFSDPAANRFEFKLGKGHWILAGRH